MRDEIGLSDSALSKHLKALSARGYTRLERAVRDGPPGDHGGAHPRRPRGAVRARGRAAADGADRRQRPRAPSARSRDTLTDVPLPLTRKSPATSESAGSASTALQAACSARPACPWLDRACTPAWPDRAGRCRWRAVSREWPRRPSRSAATPSPRPVSPSPSVVVPLTDTGAPTASESAASASTRRRADLRPVADDLHRDVADLEARIAHEPGGLGEQGHPRRPGELGAAGAEVRPEVPDAGGREERVARGVGGDVGVGVPVEPALARPVQAGHPQLAPGPLGSAKACTSTPIADPRQRAHGVSLAVVGAARREQQRSARSRSSGVVTLNASGSPSTTTHVVAAALDERGVVGGPQTAAVCRRAAPPARKPCGVCTARSAGAVGGAGDDAGGVDGLDGVDERRAGHGPGGAGAHGVDDPLEDVERGEAAGRVVDEHDVDVVDGGEPGGHGVGALGTARRPPRHPAGRSTPAQSGSPRPRVGVARRGDDDERAQVRQPRDGVDGVREQRAPAQAARTPWARRRRAGCPTRPRRRRRRRCTGQRRRRSRQCVGRSPGVRTRGPRRG